MCTSRTRQMSLGLLTSAYDDLVKEKLQMDIVLMKSNRVLKYHMRLLHF